MTGFPSFTGGSSTGAIQNTCMCPPSWRVLKPPGTGSIRPAKRGVGSGISLPCDSSRSLCLKPSVTWRKMRQKLPTWTSWNGQRSSSQKNEPGGKGKKKGSHKWTNAEQRQADEFPFDHVQQHRLASKPRHKKTTSKTEAIRYGGWSSIAKLHELTTEVCAE